MVKNLQKSSPEPAGLFPRTFGLNSIYLIMNIHVDIHTMLCETGSGSKHKAYIEAISGFHEHLYVASEMLTME